MKRIFAILLALVLLLGTLPAPVSAEETEETAAPAEENMNEENTDEAEKTMQEENTTETEEMSSLEYCEAAIDVMPSRTEVEEGFDEEMAETLMWVACNFYNGLSFEERTEVDPAKKEKLDELYEYFYRNKYAEQCGEIVTSSLGKSPVMTVKTEEGTIVPLRLTAASAYSHTYGVYRFPGASGSRTNGYVYVGWDTVEIHAHWLYGAGPVYCLHPGLSSYSSYTAGGYWYTNYSGETVRWICYLLRYGYPNCSKLNAHTEAQHDGTLLHRDMGDGYCSCQYATQALIFYVITWDWDFVENCSGSVFWSAVDLYERIRNGGAGTSHTMGSYMYASEADSAAHPLELVYDEETDAYTGTVDFSSLYMYTDWGYGNILGEFTYEKDGVNVSVSCDYPGKKQTISIPREELEAAEGTITFLVKTPYFRGDSYDNTYTQGYYASYGESSYQHMIAPAAATDTTMETVYLTVHAEVDAERSFRLKLCKSDAETGTAQGEATLEGAVYGLYCDGEKIAEYETDADGCFETELYPCGNGWTVREISPSEGYCLDETEYVLEAGRDRFTEKENLVELQVTEKVIRGKLRITKEDAQSGSPLADAWYEVFDSAGKSLGQISTGEDGVAEMENLPYGHYFYRETKAPDYYREDEASYPFFISENAQTIAETRKNERIPGSICVYKSDAQGKQLEGASYLLEYSRDGSDWQKVFYTEEGLCVGGCCSEDLQNGILTTGENGEVSFEGLWADGEIRYRLTEVGAPEGYTLLAESLYTGGLPANGEYTLRFSVSNGAAYTLPMTGQNGFFVLSVSFVLLAAAGSGLLWLKKKKTD